MSRRVLSALCFIIIVFLVQTSFADQEESGWKARWEKLVEAAESEGEVIVIGSDSHRLAALSFKEAFPKIKVRFEPGAGRHFGPRVMAERRAGKYLVDIAMLGSGTMYRVFYKGRILDPLPSTLVLPEVTDLSKWWQKKHFYADPENKHVFITQGAISTGLVAYNTKDVNPKEIKSHWDLLDPKWRGKIVAWDTRRAGQLQNLKGLYYNPKLGPEFVVRFYGETGVALSRDARQMVDWLGTGKYSLYFMARDRHIEDAKVQGLPVDMISAPPEESYISSGMGNIGLLRDAPNPNAARLFLNWLLSKRGQINWQKYVDANSMRTDIPKDTLTNWKAKVPKKGVNYILTSLPEYRDLRPVMSLVRKSLGEKGGK
jgi:iron(III) transport system substrate-binding protein